MSDKKEQVHYQDGVVIGNVEDKADLKNPVSRWLVNKFDTTVFDFLQKAEPKSIHEVGCGEGRLTKAFADEYAVPIRATDFSKDLINGLQKQDIANVVFVAKSIYDLGHEDDGADVVVCCEVLEHLEYPRKALEVLKSLQARRYILSVPREPVWCFLNMLRGKYLRDRGNTPGHLNHWSKRKFLQFLSGSGFNVLAVENPLPWTIVMGSF